MDFWTIAPILGLTTPFIWAWGVMRYRRELDRSAWRARASLVGLSAPAVSAALWLGALLLAWRVGWPASTSDRWIHRLTTIGGIWIPGIGLLTGPAGRPRLIVFIVVASLGTVFFWFATTLP